VKIDNQHMKSNQNKQISKKEDNIERLTKQLESLQIQVSNIQQELKTLLKVRDEISPPQRSKGDIRIGDKVIVLNKHRSLKNTTRKVISVASAQATVRPDNSGPDFRRYKVNLKVI
jgi:TolA-binding protein